MSTEQEKEYRQGEHRHHGEYGNGEHHGEYRHHHHHKRKIKNKALRVTLIILACFLILLVLAFGTYKIIQHMGAENLAKNATSVAPELVIETEGNTEEESKEEATTDQTLKDGEVLYNGEKYVYKSNIRTFVILGIDEMGDMDDLLASESGGQSDMIFLAVLDQDEKAIKLIGINRNTMTDVWRYDTNNEYVDTVTEQITLQHAYGSGGTDSCEMSVQAIDNLMYMVPIHGYFSMNMGAISKLNDAVGGIELTALETIPGTDIKEGEKVTLLGTNAFYYAKYRDWKQAFSADKRLERQKQYLNAFIKKTKEMVSNDLSIPLNLYNIIANYSVTDLTIDEMTYLASTAAGYSFSSDNIYSLPGETIQSETTEYEEFYVDEEALYELILEVFYEKE